jgi:hypothetical protein
MTKSQTLQLPYYCNSPFVRGVITGIIYLLLFIAPVFSQGRIWQEERYYTPNADKGSWKVTTDVYSRKTRIEFFDLDNKLIFNEELHGKWLRLTKKNQKALDAFLLQVLPNGHLIERLSTEEFPITSSIAPKKHIYGEAGVAPTNFEASVHINELDKIYIAIENKSGLPYVIEVYGRSGQQLYKEYNSLPVYRRKIDVSMVYELTYKVVITMNKKEHVYYLSHSKRNTSLQKVNSDTDKVVFYPNEYNQ